MQSDVTRLVIETSDFLNIDEMLVEKDYYVTQVIHSLSDIENEFFRLIFAGGTCLAKAHKIVNRMSEDIDFKIQPKLTLENFSNTKKLKELKAFREFVSSKLQHPDLFFNAPIVRNEGRYSKIEISYPRGFLGEHANLRPHILLELTQSDVKLPTENITVKTLIEETFDTKKLFSSLFTTCISVEETAIEKWVGLTRRIMAIERGREDDDKTLIRHVYDLNAINEANKINSTFIKFAKTIVISDGKQFKNQHPEYSADPSAEIKQSLALLKDKPLWKERYEEFIEAMVYDTTNALPYDQAIITLESISANVINNL